MAPIFFPVVQRLKTQSKDALQRVFRLAIRSVKALPASQGFANQKGCSLQNEIDTPTNFMGITSYTLTETASGCMRL